VVVVLVQSVLARTQEQIREEHARATDYLASVIARAAAARAQRDRRAADYAAEAARVRAHVLTYAWLLGDVDTAPVTGRRLTAFTVRDLAIEQAPGRDHAERNTHRYNDPERVFPEAVFDALAWARGEYDDPPRTD
jgi:hypothetical protein